MTVLPPQPVSAVHVLPTEPARPVNAPVQPAETPSAPSAEKRDALTPKSAFSKAPADEAARQAQVEAVVAQLKARDREVRAHEMAHLAAAGSYATSGAHYTWQTGPDGHRYAIGGEVGIDISPEADPEKTLAKMQVVQQAALAPANPSPQDMRVAAAAAQAMAQAQAELARQRVEGSENNGSGGEDKRGLLHQKAGEQASMIAAQKPAQPEQASVVKAGLAARNTWAQRLAVQVPGHH